MVSGDGVDAVSEGPPPLEDSLKDFMPLDRSSTGLLSAGFAKPAEEDADNPPVEPLVTLRPSTGKGAPFRNAMICWVPQSAVS